MYGCPKLSRKTLRGDRQHRKGLKQQPTAGGIFIHEFSPGRFELLVEVLFAELSIFTILLILQRGQGGIRPST